LMDLGQRHKPRSDFSMLSYLSVNLAPYPGDDMISWLVSARRQRQE
jgi:hypothetical protein